MEANGGDSLEIVCELKELKLQKAKIEQRISSLEAKFQETAAVERCDAVSNGCSVPAAIEHGLEHGISPDLIYRYSRQLLLPSFGVEGRFGIIDHDVVELNNMHRQVIHTEAFIGHPKVKSAATACRSYVQI